MTDTETQAPDGTETEAPDEGDGAGDGTEGAPDGEGFPDDDDDADAGFAPDEGGDAPADEQAVADAKAMAKRDAKLDAENVRHANRVGEIMDAGAVDLIPCPVCMDGIAGWIYAPDVQALPPEAIARVRQVIGLPDLTTFVDDPETEICPVCNGLGETRTGSRLPGYETRTCPRCAKQGYVMKGVVPVAVVNGETPAPVLTGPTTVDGAESDPEVRHLRERGFTVIAPIPIGR